MTISFETSRPSLSRAPFFTGRATFLQTLRRTLLRDRAVAITGPTGCGKTAVALEYIYRFSTEYRAVFWINARTLEAFLADTHTLFQAIDFPLDPQQDVVHIFQLVLEWLSTQPGVLLVFDDLVFLPLLDAQLVQQDTGGHILLTTHSSNIPVTLSYLELDYLDAHTGALLVLRRAGLLSPTETLAHVTNMQQAAAQELARELCGSPLALSLAGGYMRATGATSTSYLSAHRDLLEASRQSRHLNRSEMQDLELIEAAYKLTLTRLAQAQPVALKFLHQCAFLSADAIPSLLFQQIALGLTLGPQKEERAMSPLELVQLLQEYGMLDILASTDALVIHPLLQSTVRQTLPLDEQQHAAEQVFWAFHRLLLQLEEEKRDIRLRLIGHIQQIYMLSAEWTFTFNEAADVLACAASLFWEEGFIGNAEPLLRGALVIWERVLGFTHPTVATVLFNLAVLNTLLKNYGQAEEQAQRAIAVKARALGANHPDVLLGLNSLAYIYEQQQRQQSAWLCYQKVITLGDRFGLQEHSHYLLASYKLALLAIQQKHFDKAKPWLEKVCMAWEHSPGLKDPATIHAWHTLAQVSVEVEDWAQALLCYRRLVPAYEVWKGVEDLATLHCMKEAADVQIQLDYLAEAEANLQYILSLSERIQGIAHPDVAACLNSLAQIAILQEHYAEARALLARAQSIYESRPEAEDCVLAELLDNVVQVHILQEEYEQAIPTLERSLAIKKLVLGDEHVKLVENLTLLGRLYLAQGQIEQAEPLLLCALNIYQCAQKPEDLTLDPALDSLATIAMAREHYGQARMFLGRSYAIRKLALGEASSEVVEIIQKLAMIALLEGEWEQTQKLLQRLPQVKRVAQGSGNQADKELA